MNQGLKDTMMVVKPLGFLNYQRLRFRGQNRLRIVRGHHGKKQVLRLSPFLRCHACLVGRSRLALLAAFLGGRLLHRTRGCNRMAGLVVGLERL